MATRRRAFALLFLLALPLAGCLGGEAPAATTDANATVDTGEGAAPAAAPAAAMVDPGSIQHAHDYWVGRERVTLFDGMVEPGQEEMAFATLASLFFAREARAGGTTWLLPDGAIVFEGTGRLELTATLEDPTVTSIGVAYKSAQGPEWTAWSAMEPGKPFSIDVAPAMTDMPHSGTSRWAFAFAPESPGALLGPFRLKVDIVRMADVTEFPAHPDLFDGGTEKVLMQEHVRAEKASYATKGGEVVTEGQFVEPEFRLASLVPMETALLRVEVRITGAEATGAQVTEARFFYRGADTSQLQRGGAPVEGSFEEGYLVWEVPVEMEMTDSPYGAESQWFLMVEPATSFTGKDATCGGCVHSSLEFDVLVTAFRATE